MGNFEIGNNDSSKVVIFNGIFQEEGAKLKFAGAATVVAGTVLGMALVAAGSVTPNVGNTGDGVVSVFALANGGPAKPGNYNLECVEAITNSGRFKLVDPNGVLIINNIIIPVSGNITIEIDGITFNIADGATDFVVGDKFALAVASVNEFVPFKSDNVDGSEIPKAILNYEKIATGAGSLDIRPCIAGEVLNSQLVFEKTGDDMDTVPAGQTETVRELLRKHGIILRVGQTLDELDNQ